MKYIVSAGMTVSCYTVVEAESEGEALEIAEMREPAGMCHGALSPDIGESWHFENDGMPFELKAEVKDY